ncbi:MAG: hypothetical protein L6Q71_04165, partial [Planctomycetes bacterium]|nr:hypothetical protein [Planctomycetota bacterium]
DVNKADEVQFVDAKDCIIAEEIWGDWIINKELTEKVGSTVPRRFEGAGKASKVSFKENEKAKNQAKEFARESIRKAREGLEVPMAPEELERKKLQLARMLDAFGKLYCGGEMTVYEDNGEITYFPFAYGVAIGNPMVIYVRNVDKQPDGESFFLSFVRDSKGEKDLLFIGGDHPPDRFSAFERVKVEEKADEVEKESDDKEAEKKQEAPALPRG